MKLWVKKITWPILTALILAVAGISNGVAGHAIKQIHMKIVSAPVVPNGILASEPTEFNILVHRQGVRHNKAMDTDTFGLQIPVGGRMEVELGGSFIPNPDFMESNPAVPLFKPARNIILTTGPQNPVKPNTEEVSGGFWGVSYDQVENPRVVSIFPRCVADVDCQNLDASYPGGLNGTRARALGFKVIHIRPNDRAPGHDTTPFYNGPAGTIGRVMVRLYNAKNVLVAKGSARIVFRHKNGAQIYLTNGATRDDNSVISLTHFQHVSPNTIMERTSIPEGASFTAGLPYAPQFLLFKKFKHNNHAFHSDSGNPVAGSQSFLPFPGIEGITVVPYKRNPRFAYLFRKNGKKIGYVLMTGPKRKNGAEILGNNVPTGADDGANGSRLFVPVKVGHIPGRYRVIVHLYGGGTAINTIIVEKTR